jgi:hypothetical protein
VSHATPRVWLRAVSRRSKARLQALRARLEAELPPSISSGFDYDVSAEGGEVLVSPRSVLAPVRFGSFLERAWPQPQSPLLLRTPSLGDSSLILPHPCATWLVMPAAVDFPSLLSRPRSPADPAQVTGGELDSAAPRQPPGGGVAAPQPPCSLLIDALSVPLPPSTSPSAPPSPSSPPLGELGFASAMGGPDVGEPG